MHEIIGMILSLCGMAITVCSFQIGSKKGLLIFQTVGTGFFLVSYVFSGGGIAVYLNCIYLVRNFLFLFFGERKGAKTYVAVGALCAAYASAYILYICLANIDTAEKLWNLLPVAGAVFGTVAVAHANANRLRLWKTGDSTCWLIFNIRIGLGALGGILGEIFNLASIGVGLLRFKRKKTDTTEPSSADGQNECKEKTQ